MFENEAMRIAIIGNSGSGKSTLARRLAERHGLPTLELDSVVWEPGKIAILRSREETAADVEQFVTQNDRWVVEGCYGELVEAILPRCTELIFLNPGAAVCRENNLRRPWEPHKYESAEAQAGMLDALLAWVDAYYTRDDEWSLACHRRVFDNYGGKKFEITGSISGITAEED